ncbi:MAG: type II toxin-antitoxin system RelE/ParE family toxin [Methylococcales symbiont of Hymedesmia sp. n. MRB-2018]|nr:MAG: type II toxin-antitoxin system RelE/ParE family toxin [Methylococcales symbiont of Hymedesmia sp. n. MRB-2018]KAF3984650.1 MAG: type II toxin-antitoxin system RelE/ParE family toxin [Methylococcales symbiont of Hymedesmia sp. n. MRB-2018]
MRISYTPESIGDLKRLREFIGVKDPLVAQRVATSILKGISQLKTFPYIGVEVQQAPNPEIVRDLIIGNYIARYLIRSKKIDILRVWHHKEDRL